MSVQTLHGTMNNDKHETEKRLQIVAENINSLIKAIEECLRKPKNQRIRLGITSFTHLVIRYFFNFLLLNHYEFFFLILLLHFPFPSTQWN